MNNMTLAEARNRVVEGRDEDLQDNLDALLAAHRRELAGQVRRGRLDGMHSAKDIADFIERGDQ